MAENSWSHQQAPCICDSDSTHHQAYELLHAASCISPEMHPVSQPCGLASWLLCCEGGEGSSCEHLTSPAPRGRPPQAGANESPRARDRR
eukprot:364779-Chlamydomonas_euryale.AAC.18